MEQQERERVLQQQQSSPRAGTPVGTMMGVVPPPSAMGMLNQAMPPVPGNAKSPQPLLKEIDAAAGHPLTILTHSNQLHLHSSTFPSHVTALSFNYSVPHLCWCSSFHLCILNHTSCVFLNIVTFFIYLHDNLLLLTP